MNRKIPSGGLMKHSLPPWHWKVSTCQFIHHVLSEEIWRGWLVTSVGKTLEDDYQLMIMIVNIVRTISIPTHWLLLQETDTYRCVPKCCSLMSINQTANQYMLNRIFVLHLFQHATRETYLHDFEKVEQVNSLYSRCWSTALPHALVVYFLVTLFFFTTLNKLCVTKVHNGCHNSKTEAIKEEEDWLAKPVGNSSW